MTMHCCPALTQRVVPKVGQRLISNHGRGPLTATVTKIEGEWVYLDIEKNGRFEISGRLRQAVFTEPSGCGWRPEKPAPKIGEPIVKPAKIPRIENKYKLEQPKPKLSPSRWYGPRVIPVENVGTARKA